MARFAKLGGALKLFEMQEEVLRFWKDERIFERSVEQRPADETYSFYDGPPFITGIPHYATLLPSIAKDIVPRYQAMKGKRVRRVWGWDCHGLPAETKVEQQLGIKSKREIEELGIDKFVAACREYVSTVSAQWRWYVDHVGRWVDMDHAYRTMDQAYMESVMWAFKELYEKELIYEGVRSSLYCPRCATPLSKFEVTMDEGFYREVSDPAVTVRFRLKDRDVSLLAWTTTPWTLPSNRAVAVDESATYVEVEAREGGTVVLAESALERYGDELGEVVRRLPGSELVGLAYEPLYTYGPVGEHDYVVYAALFVTLDEGTGIVHVAPAFGEDDFTLGQEHGLSIFLSLDAEGAFTDEVPEYAGMKYKDADGPIMDELASRGLLFKRAVISHQYPFCYRCETPLIYKVQDAWYLRIADLREKLLAANQGINWVPESFKHGRFEYTLTSAPDWSLSRSRYWGTPIPVWKCETCAAVVAVGSVAELEELSGSKVVELHRPEIDEVTWTCAAQASGTPCTGTMRRVPEVLDVWFESGSMPFAQCHYPFEKQEEFEKSFPADFVVEYTGQLRGWFYYLHVIGNALFDSAAFTNVVVTGVMKGDDGRKMSKSFGNYPDPKATIQKYGSEAIRLYFMSNPIMNGEDMNVTEKDLVEHYRKIMLILWNSYRYFLEYAQKHDFTPQGEVGDHVLDRWIIGQVERLTAEIDAGLEAYDFVRAARAVRPFVDDLSTWYIRRSRARFVAGERAALETLYHVLVRFARAAAPLIPFTTESMYRNLVDLTKGDVPESVHLTDWVEADEQVIQDTEETAGWMRSARALASVALAQRATAGVRVRQPLARLMVASDRLPDDVIELVADEVNVKEVSFGGEETKLDLELTPELKAEGLAREIIRHGQVLRREAGYALDDRIVLVMQAEEDELGRVLDEQGEGIKEALQVDRVVTKGEIEEDVGREVEVEGERVYLGVGKIK